jgi:hypothetical protein
LSIPPPDQSPLAHLAYSVWLNKAIEIPEVCRMAMFTAYYDDSGHFAKDGWPDNTPVLMMGGFVAPVDQWLRFEDDWKWILRLPQFGLDYFHMKELRQAKREPWLKFKDNLALETELFVRLHALIRARVSTSMASVLVLSAWDALNAEYELAETYKSPLEIVGTLIVKKTLDWKEQYYQNDDLKFVVDEGITGFGRLDDRIYAEHEFRLIPGAAKALPPLQAGDLVSWEINRALSLLLQGKIQKRSKLRRSFELLLEQFGMRPGKWILLDQEGMRATFDKIGYPAKRKAAVSVS